MFTAIIKKMLQQIRISLGIAEMKSDLEILRKIAIENYIARELRENPRFINKKRLNRYEYKVYSQFGEDGIIEEIFKRIGTTNKYFVEIGAGDGTENNTINLLTMGWKGVWIEGNSTFTTSIEHNFSNFINRKKLIIINKFINCDNIQILCKNAHVPKDLDMLSIDIDGNDYWLWDTLKTYRPRVVVIEYNASLGPKAAWIMKYEKNHVYNQTRYHGASLKSLELLGKKMGYALVGCSLSGVNAFFVRKELTGDKFLTPPTSETFFESPKYYIFQSRGHPQSPAIFNDYV